MGIQDEDINTDIMRHRYATVSSLCDALNKDENHQQILEAALGLITEHVYTAQLRASILALLDKAA